MKLKIIYKNYLIKFFILIRIAIEYQENPYFPI